MVLSRRLLPAGSGLPYLAPYSVPDNNASGAFDTPTGIVWSTSYGYYEDNEWNGFSSNVTIPNLSDGRGWRFTATIYGYYNVPSGCLGQNYVKVIFSGGGALRIGTSDPNAVAINGQTIYKGDYGTSAGTTNATGQTYTATAPSGQHITSVEFYSSKNTTFPPAYRGISGMTMEYYN